MVNVSAVGPTEPPPPSRDDRAESANDSTEDSGANWSGTTLMGRYRLIRKIGQGGMGDVYEGHHELIGKRVAVKCLHPEFAHQKQVVERFKREARAAALVGNEHIVEVMDMGDLPDGAPFLVMEFLAGKTLADLIAEGPLPLGRVADIMIQVCEALEAAHQKGIVHRDLKPENLFLVERNKGDFVKILDFGISKMQEPGKLDNLTRTGMAMGTPYYMSPEQAQGLRTVDHRADVWSMGIILYEMLTGELPFNGESFPMLLLKVMTETPPPVTSRRTDLPIEVETVFRNAIAKNPDERTPSMRALGAALEKYRWVTDAPVLVAPGGTSALTANTLPLGQLGQPVQQNPNDPNLTSGIRVGTLAPTMVVGKGRSSLLLVIALLVVGLAGGAFWWFNRPVEAPTAVLRPTEVTPTSPIAAQPPTAVEALPPPVVAPAISEVRIRVRVNPSEAHIFIGDVEYPNPMDAMQPRSTTPTRLRVESPGYESIDRLIILDSEQNMDLALSRSRGSSRSPETRATPEDGVYRGSQRNYQSNF